MEIEFIIKLGIVNLNTPSLSFQNLLGVSCKCCLLDADDLLHCIWISPDIIG
jgi:hypothetical protein